jgi:2-polyprenyl-3-methyl-5-hydroxy-6-metoxy-1,4-benzoquinol methylase
MSQEVQFQRHALEWTPAKIARFWDFESQNEAKKGEYFTWQVGDALVRLARLNQTLAEPVLDYGAGVGYLTERLVNQGVKCAACDFSSASVKSLNQRLAGQPAFLTCEWLQTLPSSMAGATYGTVFLVETLEHLLPEWRKSTLQEVWRVLKPGGRVIVTVPHMEDLEAAKVICADCGAVFHRVQHVAAFDRKSLSAVMAEYGFAEVLCQPMCLLLWKDEMQQKGKRFRRWSRRLLTRLHLLAPRRESTPNLFYIGQKG